VTLYRTGGALARSADGALGRCCCEPGCVTWGGILIVNFTPQFGGQFWPSPPMQYHPPNMPAGTIGSLPTCVRSLVWKGLYWNADEGWPVPWHLAGRMTEADWTLRNALYCDNGDETPAGTQYPIVSRCWDLNPVTGTGDFDYSSMLLQFLEMSNEGTALQTGLFPTEVKSILDAYADRRFTLAIRCDTYTTAVKRDSGFDSWGSTSHVYFSATLYYPTEEEAAIIDAATLETTC